MGDLSENFSLEEFRHANTGRLPPESTRGNIRDTIEFLERLRFLMNWIVMNRSAIKFYPNIGIQVTPNGGYRFDPEGKKTSRHYCFQAADVRPIGLYSHGFTYDEFYWMAEQVDKSFKHRPYRLGKYLGYGQQAWVHIDCAYGYAGLRWTYKKGEKS